MNKSNNNITFIFAKGKSQLWSIQNNDIDLALNIYAFLI